MLESRASPGSGTLSVEHQRLLRDKLRQVKPRSNRFNRKRRLLSPEQAVALRRELCELAARVRYGGNSEHKRNPGDFGLTPPAGPRPGKSLCDVAGAFTRAEAVSLLRRGLELGMVSDRFEGIWPFNVWAVTANGIPLEAEWEAEGTYHGYPMPEQDPFRSVVLERWSALA